MRLHFENMTRPRLVARALKKALAKLDRPRPFAECQEIAARMFGYARWDELGKLHADGPVGPDDVEAQPEEVASRRRHYGVVLSEAGIPHERIGAILDAVRPSDRTAKRTNFRDFPRLLVEGVETDNEGNHIRQLGLQDLTRVVIDRMLPYSNSPIRPFPAEHPTVTSLHEGLSEEARRIGYDGRLALPGLSAAIGNFIDRIGGLDAIARFKKRLDVIRTQERKIEEAKRELDRVRKADFSRDFSKLDFVYLSHEDKFLADFEDAYADWAWDDYVASHPRPPMPLNDECGANYAAWQAAYAAYVRATAPPYVFGTWPMPWNGVKADDIRTGVKEDGGEFDIDDLLTSEMDQHYEDAYYDIEDRSGLQALVDRLAKKELRFPAFKRELAAWNDRQRITSYFPDYETALPAFAGKTKADAITWCEAELSAQMRKLADLQIWIPPVAEPPLAEPAP